MKRALLVGINDYPDPTNRLNGCINDVDQVRNLLISFGGYSASSCAALTDAAATRDAIAHHLQAMTTGLASGDRMVFFYSGHGCQMPEIDSAGNVIALHDAMCPYDFDWTNERAIRDVDFSRIFGNVAPGAKVSWISDSCFAGGYAKLFSHFLGAFSTTIIKTIPPPPEIQAQISAFLQRPKPQIMRFGDVAQTLQRVSLLAACTAGQKSEDASWPGGNWEGVFTYFLADEYRNRGGATKSAQQIVADLKSSISRSGHGQTPEYHGDPTLATSPIFQ